MLWHKFLWNTYSKSYMVFQLTSWPLIWMTFKDQIKVIEFLMGWILLVMTKVYMKHLVSHIGYFSWPHYLWPWMIFKVVNGPFLLNGACHDQILHETHIGSHIHVYGFSVDLVIFELNDHWPWMTFKCKIGHYGSDFEQYLNKFHFW